MTIAEAAAAQQGDRSTVLRVRTVAKEGALASKPGVQGRDRDYELEQVQQAGLGDRVDSARDPATYPQRPFPSTKLSLTAISLSASDSRATSALDASSWLGARR